RALTHMAEEMGTTMARLAIAWTLKNPNVSTVILGASRLSQLEDNLQAIEVVPQLTEDVMAQIETVLGNKPKPMDFQ
ncbi:MAG: aldo/keto reductase, partial [Anaerolineales bacterium]|nr:aldo/keto reductase [Anaerolineales bacterium]